MYCQSLHGVGHFVRCARIADALSTFADVVLVNGGRRMPVGVRPQRARVVEFPGVFRDLGSGAVRSEEDGLPLQSLSAARRAALAAALGHTAVDLVITEYFPFQRHEFLDEVLFLIAQVKQANPQCRVCCSVRDFPRLSENAKHDSMVVALLREYFDAILVHGDQRVCGDFPAFATLVAAAPRLRVVFTGYVAPKAPPSHRPSSSRGVPIRERRNVLVSTGGGADGQRLLMNAMRAWFELRASGLVDGHVMVLFLGPYLSDSSARILYATASKVPGVLPMQYSPAFLHYLASAAVSVSCAGYNTCVEVMLAQTSSIFVPSDIVSDQHIRARRLTALGVGRVIPGTDDSVSPLAKAIAEGLRDHGIPPPVSLDGLAETLRAVRHLLSLECPREQTTASRSG
jgi:predicted glycosyltransferase